LASYFCGFNSEFDLCQDRGWIFGDFFRKEYSSYEAGNGFALLLYLFTYSDVNVALFCGGVKIHT